MFNFEAGETLLFDKPKGWSSFDLVKKVRNMIRFKKIGHAGTLDPLATGLMILCTGKHTKTIDTVQAQEKVYEAVIYLGATTQSYDAEHSPENLKDTSHLTQGMIEEAMKTFEGEIQQMPPIFSAIQIDGKRAYQLARKGKEVKLQARTVHIYEYKIIDYISPAYFSVLIRCSKGTYIRSLAHDLGQKLGVGGYLLELKRTKIGDFDLKDAWTVDTFKEALEKIDNA